MYSKPDSRGGFERRPALVCAMWLVLLTLVLPGIVAPGSFCCAQGRSKALACCAHSDKMAGMGTEAIAVLRGGSFESNTVPCKLAAHPALPEAVVGKIETHRRQWGESSVAICPARRGLGLSIFPGKTPELSRPETPPVSPQFDALVVSLRI